MATGKGRGARDLVYGRRGGGWVDEGHAPGNADADIDAARQRAGGQWPTAVHRAPGLAGQDTPGWARMAAARRAAQPAAAARLNGAATILGKALARRMAADVHLDELDLQALNHHRGDRP